MKKNKEKEGFEYIYIISQNGIPVNSPTLYIEWSIAKHKYTTGDRS